MAPALRCGGVCWGMYGGLGHSISFICRCTRDELSGGEPSSTAFDPNKICTVDALGLMHVVCTLRMAMTLNSIYCSVVLVKVAWQVSAWIMSSEKVSHNRHGGQRHYSIMWQS